MSPIGTVSSGMTQAIMTKPPAASQSGAPSVVDPDNEGGSDANASAPGDSSNGKHLNISA